MEEKDWGEQAERFMIRYGKFLIHFHGTQTWIVSICKFDRQLSYYTDWPERKAGSPLEYLPEPRRVSPGAGEDAEELNIEGFDLCMDVLDVKAQKLVSKRAEIKATGYFSSILFGQTEYPTIPIEIISNSWGEGADRKATPGWLWHLTHIQQSNEMRKDSPKGLRAIMPHCMVFCLYAGRAGEGVPYAVIAFPDAGKLFEALKAIAAERFGWDIEQWKQEAQTEEQKCRVEKETKKMYWNCSLGDLIEKKVPYEITMINNDPPLIDRDGKPITSYKAKQRYSKIIELAQYKIITTEWMDRYLAEHRQYDELKGLSPEEAEAQLRRFAPEIQNKAQT